MHKIGFEIAFCNKLGKWASINFDFQIVTLLSNY